MPTKPGDPLYALEKLGLAVHELATGAGDVRSRLIAAFMAVHPVKSRDLPQELRADFEWIITQLTRYPKRSEQEGAIHHTLSRMQNRTGVEIAERLVYVHARLAALVGQE